MTKIERMQDFEDWLFLKVKSIHVMTIVEFENIMEKI